MKELAMTQKKLEIRRLFDLKWPMVPLCKMTIYYTHGFNENVVKVYKNCGLAAFLKNIEMLTGNSQNKEFWKCEPI